MYNYSGVIIHDRTAERKRKTKREFWDLTVAAGDGTLANGELLEGIRS